MNITFTFLESLRSETPPESLSKMQLWGDPNTIPNIIAQRKLRGADILAFIYIVIYVYIYYMLYI